MSFFKIVIVLISLTFLSLPSVGANESGVPIGKVQLIKGRVSALHPHTLEAIQLKKGDPIYEESSLLSNKKSFVKIKLDSGASINLGPKSKLVVTSVSKKDKSSMLTLLKGSLRGKVEKRVKKNFIVKSRSAAMGVRGTEFIFSHSPESKRSSLLTLEGEVSFKKVDVDRTMRLSSKNSNNVKLVDNIIKENSRSVSTGDFANVTQAQEQALEPVKVNPEQLTRLQLDQTMGVEPLKIEKELLDKKIAETEILLKEKTSSKENAASIKSGGFVDLQNGLYVPPLKQDSTSGKPSLGTLDSNGKFKLAKGVAFVETKGFVRTDGKSDKAIEEANKSLTDQGIKPQDPKKPMNKHYRRYFKGREDN